MALKANKEPKTVLSYESEDQKSVCIRLCLIAEVKTAIYNEH
jgi:hypothetical protein